MEASPGRNPRGRGPGGWPCRTRGRWALVLVLVALVLGIFPPLASASGPPPRPRVHGWLMDQAAKHPNDYQRVIVLRNGGNRAADQYVASKGAHKLGEVGSVGFVASVRGADLADLGRHPSIKYITPDSVMRQTATVDVSNLTTFFSQSNGAAQLAASGITGAGVGVAVVDSGINASLPDFGDGNGGSRVVAQTVFNAALTSPNDDNGHGTHVAGIIGGNSWLNATNLTAQGKYIGVAPQAQLINVRVSDAQGQSHVSDVINAIDWVIANRATYDIRVLNLSLVSATAESATTSPLDAEVEKAWFNGIFVVTAAGNTGPNTELYPPANDPFVVTVGAADPMNTVTPTDDTIAPWSSYGTTEDGYSKPDVVAVGRYVASTLASPTSTFALDFPDRIRDVSYIWMSGTSMAAPVVSGVAALAFQVHPDWTNDQVKSLMVQTATPLSVAGSGAGEVMASSVVSYAAVPGLANQGLPINQLLSGPNGSTTYTNATTGSSSSWDSSSWDSASWSSSSWDSSSWDSSSWDSSTLSASAAVR